MAKIDVLVEVIQPTPDAFAAFHAAMASEGEAVRQGETLMSGLAGFGLEVVPDFAPIPLFEPVGTEPPEALARFAQPAENADLPSASVVVPCRADRARLEDLRARAGIRVYPNSRLSLYRRPGGDWRPVGGGSPFDLAASTSGVDCRPYVPAVDIEVIRALLGVERVWWDGFRGQSVIVGVIDEGINGGVYPVVGGFTGSDLPRPGSAEIESHGSMCAADVLVAAPAVKLYDYRFLEEPRSGGAMAMFQEVLDQRRRDGTPHLTSNSYGFMGRPLAADNPHHEVYDLDHPLHRKAREVVASGCPTFFAAGNCGTECPSGMCHPSGIGPGQSIHASNSLSEVITVAAVNHRHDRIGYSSQGPGGFEREKPDVACYSHFFGNFGPGRPAGIKIGSFDSGTSAAAPLAAGVGALLLSAFPDLTPGRLKQALIRGAVNIGPPGWDSDTGYGVVNAAATYNLLLSGAV